MIQETILICGVIYIIIWLFYHESVPEFRINQIEWANRLTIPTILPEKLPIVVRNIPQPTIWTQEDVLNRSIYSTVPVFANQTISQWLSGALKQNRQFINSPWTLEHARRIAQQSGIKTWTKRWLLGLMYPQWAEFIGLPQSSCWIGARSIWKSCAPWTSIIPTEGEIVVSIMPSKGYSHALPTNPENYWLPRITKFDTPFVGDLKFIDIRLRPGHMLIIPAHWMVSWEESELDIIGLKEYGLKSPPMVCLVEFHNFFSIIEDWKVLKSSCALKIENVKQRTGPVISYQDAAAEVQSESQPEPQPEPQPESESGPDTTGGGDNSKSYREFHDSDEDS
jgi:hypothetical protein